MVIGFEQPRLYNQEQPEVRGQRKEREILGTVNQEARQEVAEVIEQVRHFEGEVDASLVERVAEVFSKMSRYERAAVIDKLFENVQIFESRQQQRTAMIEWVMHHQVIDEEEEIDPTNPESPWMNNVHAALADKLGAELHELEYYTAVDSPLDWREGIDGFFIWRSPEGDKIATFDFTTSLHKENNRVDMVLYWSAVPVHPDERTRPFFYLGGPEARGPQIQRETERFFEMLAKEGLTNQALFKPITWLDIDKK